MKNIIIFIVVILMVACSNDFRQKQVSNDSVFSNLKRNRELIEVVQFTPKIDTVSLKLFWINFQKSLINQDKVKLRKCINFPIHATNLVTFQFSYDCDTLKFQKNEKIFIDFDIDSIKFTQNYNLVFPNFFKKMILKTSFDTLMRKGIKNTKEQGLSFDFFTKDYFQINCPNDHVLMFYFSFVKNDWKVTFGGL